MHAFVRALGGQRAEQHLDAGAAEIEASKLALAATKNVKFDERYARHFGVRAHQDTIKLFQDAAREAKDPEVKAWATKTLPGLRHHLEMAQRLSGSAKK
jgi:putative membrane protein